MDFKHIARPYFQAQLIWDVSHARVRPRFMGLCSKDYCHTKNDSWLHLFTSLCLRAISNKHNGVKAFHKVAFEFSFNAPIISREIFYSAIHVLLSRFYPDFIQILSRFYPDFILILSRFYPDFLKTHFIQILSRFYPDFIWIKFG